ncbi:FixH family protein [Alicyclobacillus shizuokensis]|uniref:FixH family protein n=1 Tax=Alicyclobacillus shizuokensis TaxID=392014 RepID=UPI0008352E08|nr:FixH family protein [Alicyclobacillus shizuokensis]MCL6625593.1 FixH family protein [Alicyclobacillus shizuokensis]
MRGDLRAVLTVVGAAALGLAAGCGQPINHVSEAQAKAHISQMQSLPKVKLHLDGPDGLSHGQPVTISVRVTQNGQPVNDADMVEFELWQQGAPAFKHHFLTAKRTGDGVYSAVFHFPAAGPWQVMYHVTARGTHVMEPTRVTVK